MTRRVIVNTVAFVFFALIVGFLAGHGFELVVDLVPLLLAVSAGYLALSATTLLYHRD